MNDQTVAKIIKNGLKCFAHLILEHSKGILMEISSSLRLAFRKDLEQQQHTAIFIFENQVSFL